MGFDISKGKVTPQHAIMLNKAEEEIPSMSDVANADNVELQDFIMENALRSMEDLIKQLRNYTQTQTDELFKHPLKDLLGFDKELRSIRGSLKVETAKKVEFYENI